MRSAREICKICMEEIEIVIVDKIYWKGKENVIDEEYQAIIENLLLLYLME